ncbi:DNA polymerase III subunit beta [Rhodococcus sp. ABRD24]|nr:DNA polymerase III subunit beta [Rhodococcus sp. ABRD24]
MKLRIERDALARSLSIVGPSVPVRPPVPTLGGVLLEAGDESVRLSGFDYEFAAQSSIPTTAVAEPGSALVSGRLLTEIVKLLPPHSVDFSVDGTNLNLACGQSRFALPLMPVMDYPPLPTLPDTTGVVDREAFSAAVAQVAVAAGRDDTLPFLTGISIEFHDKFIRLVATDRFRIAIRELDWTPIKPSTSTEPSSVLVPSRTLAAATKTMTGSQIEIGSAPGQQVLGLQSRNQHSIMRLLDSPFAPYERYLTHERTSTAVVDPAPFIEAIKRVSLLASRGSKILFSFSDDAVHLSAGSDGEGRGEETLACEFEGEPLTIAFSPRYLMDGLGAARATKVEIVMNGSIRAATLRSVDDSGDADQASGRRLYVLMPMRL